MDETRKALTIAQHVEQERMTQEEVLALCEVSESIVGLIAFEDAEGTVVTRRMILKGHGDTGALELVRLLEDFISGSISPLVEEMCAKQGLGEEFPKRHKRVVH